MSNFEAGDKRPLLLYNLESMTSAMLSVMEKSGKTIMKKEYKMKK
jgi:hypothetical protein